MTSVPYPPRPTGLQLSGERGGSAAYRRLAEANPRRLPTRPGRLLRKPALQCDRTALRLLNPCALHQAIEYARRSALSSA